MRQLLIAPLFLFAACNITGERIRGNGHVISDDRDLGSFTNVDASGALKLHLVQGNQAGVRVEADENILPYIETYIKDGTLVIKTKNNYHLNPTKEIVVYAMADHYNHISGSGAVDILSDALSSNDHIEMELSGSGAINAQVTAPGLSVDISGSGDVLLDGTVREFAGSVSGSGSIRAFELNTEHTRIDISGAADAEVTASQTLDVEVSGSGDVEYKGDARVNQHVSGSGSVKKVG